MDCCCLLLDCRRLHGPCQPPPGRSDRTARLAGRRRDVEDIRRLPSTTAPSWITSVAAETSPVTRALDAISRRPEHSIEPFTSPRTVTCSAVMRAETCADSSTTTRCLLSISPWTAPRTRIERSERMVPSMLAPSPTTVSASSMGCVPLARGRERRRCYGRRGRYVGRGRAGSTGSGSWTGGGGAWGGRYVSVSRWRRLGERDGLLRLVVWCGSSSSDDAAVLAAERPGEAGPLGFLSLLAEHASSGASLAGCDRALTARASIPPRLAFELIATSGASGAASPRGARASPRRRRGRGRAAVWYASAYFASFSSSSSTPRPGPVGTSR